MIAIVQHMDHKSELARQKSAELILQRLQQNITSESRPLVVVLGDLNSREDQAAYQVLTGGRYGSEDLQARLSSGLVSAVDAQKVVKLRKPSGGSAAPVNTDGLSCKPYGSNGTVTGFAARSSNSNIDHILLADNGAVAEEGEWEVRRFGIIPNKVEDGQYSFRSSDHNLVVAVLKSR